MSTGPAYDTKEQIRQSVDIVDLVNGYITLRRQGQGYVGVCPWHDDKRPSLQVNPRRQSWKCWVCDIGGDIFSFVMQREGVEFREALTMLADRAGIELQPSRPQKPVEPGSPEDKQTLYRAVAWAENQFHQFLLRSSEADPARQYLEDRGVTPQSVEQFHLGYAPDNYQWLLDRASATPFTPAVLAAVGLAGKTDSGRYYDRFRGRVIFSIRDTQRRPIAFGGRILPMVAQQQEKKSDRTPAKYINSPETRLFSKSEHLYGLDIVRDSVAKSRSVVVVEGYTDVVMAAQFGLENVTAVLGTALGQRHLRLLRRFADTVTLVLDGDEAGQRRTNEILELFIAEQLDLRILTLPEELDPCDFLLREGAEAFRQLIDSAVDALEHKIRVVTAGLDPATQTHRANQALEELLGTLAKAPRLQSGTTMSNRLREQQILSRLAREFRIEETDLRARLNELRRQAKSRPVGPPQAEEMAESEPADFSSEEFGLIEVMVLRADLASTAIEQVPLKWFSPGPLCDIYSVYGELSRLGEPLEFGRVMAELEDPKLKNLLVGIDDQATEKANHATLDDDAHLRDLIQRFHSRRELIEARRLTSELETGQLEEDDELKILLEIHQKVNQRQTELIDQSELSSQSTDRQGISAPTDG